MNIVLIGSGNVAWNLGRLLVHHQHTVVQIIGRNQHTASALAYELNTYSANHISIIDLTADLYILAVQDNAIAEIAKELKGLQKPVVHTSGALSMELLKDCGENYGVFYPLQSLVYGTKNLPEIPFLVQASNPSFNQFLTILGDSLQSRVQTVKDTDKIAIHVAAVLVNNFTTHLYQLAFDWCTKKNLDFKLLLPLIKNSVLKITEQQEDNLISPAAFQTGPAIRNDLETIKMHEVLLAEESYLLTLYQLLTKGIQQKSSQHVAN